MKSLPVIFCLSSASCRPGWTGNHFDKYGDGGGPETSPGSGGASADYDNALHHGRSFGTNVLEAALVASVGAKQSLPAAQYEKLLAAYDLQPSVEVLSEPG
jgi:hypothetical protein